MGRFLRWRLPNLLGDENAAGRILWLLFGLLRIFGIGAVAGIGAGLVVGGLGSRIAMRISAIATGSSCASLMTENGNRCGEITAEGTVGLLIFGGLASGILGGLI